LLRLYFRVRVSGARNIPERGAAIIAANHKDFWDAFFIALATGRHVRFMTATETMRGWRGRLLVALGAFPVRRGESDREAIETSRAILRQGGLLAVFPEGITVGGAAALGPPHRGAARLALELGAPLVPAAIVGTHDLSFGPIPKPRRVLVSFTEPIPVAAAASATPEAAGELIEDQVWPSVERQLALLRARPGLVALALGAIGLGGLVAARRRAATRRRSLRGLAHRRRGRPRWRPRP
jgi:1-acyl-sn-glycerol-3-phosphate acyltransferase